MEKLSFKRNESFSLRNGWTQKAIIEIENNPDTNVFSKDRGCELLGVGSNMVNSIRYWLTAAGILDGKGSRATSSLSQFGRLIAEHDKYLESKSIWFIIHYNLVSNSSESPLFGVLFHDCPLLYSFEKKDFADFAKEVLERRYEGFTANEEYISSDSSVLLRSYVRSDYDDPENDVDCPLSRLGLLRLDKSIYKKTSPDLSDLDPRIFYYVLIKEMKNAKMSGAIDISEILDMKNGPCSVFNLDASMLMAILISLDTSGYIRLSKTAGLNMVYPEKYEKGYSLESLFGDIFGGEK